MSGDGRFRGWRRASAGPTDGAAPLGEDLDDLDVAIVSELQNDGRRPYRAIARKLGVAEGTVRFRARRLQQEGILTILGFANPHRLGYEVLASLFLCVEPSHHRSVVETVKAWPEVMYLSSCAGRVDLYMQVVCRDHEELYRLLTERIPTLEGATRAETVIELEVHKAHYVYPGLTPDAAGELGAAGSAESADGA